MTVAIITSKTRGVRDRPPSGKYFLDTDSEYGDAVAAIHFTRDGRNMGVVDLSSNNLRPVIGATDEVPAVRPAPNDTDAWYCGVTSSSVDSGILVNGTDGTFLDISVENTIVVCGLWYNDFSATSTDISFAGTFSSGNWLLYHDTGREKISLYMAQDLQTDSPAPVSGERTHIVQTKRTNSTRWDHNSWTNGIVGSQNTFSTRNISLGSAGVYIGNSDTYGQPANGFTYYALFYNKCWNAEQVEYHANNPWAHTWTPNRTLYFIPTAAVGGADSKNVVLMRHKGH